MSTTSPVRSRVIALLLVIAGAVLPTWPAPGIVGGGPAAEGSWPSAVALVRADAADHVAGQFCGAAAIAEDLVLTAAHCFHTEAGVRSREPADVLVVAGRQDLANAAVGVTRLGVELLVHPEFDAATRRHDVAVLRVDGPLEVPPQRLADPVEEGAEAASAVDNGVVTVIVGWGRTGPDDDQASARTARLHEAHVRVAGERTCERAFDPSPDPAVHLCAGGRGSVRSPGPDACRGDSGGPMVLPVADEPAVQVAITSFGPAECGVEDPGVYARVDVARSFIDAVVDGSFVPTPADPGAAAPEAAVRVTGDADGNPVDLAVAASRAVFSDHAAPDATGQRANVAAIARFDTFPDGLAGSPLLYARGPMLFTTPEGPLAVATRDELRRVLPPGGAVYLLGGTAAIPEIVAEQVREDGFVPVRLAGTTREGTAARIAREVVARHGQDGRPPFGTVLLATSGSWPDAVLAGQLSVWWGYPILLTAPDALSMAAAAALEDFDVDRLLVVGGPNAVGDAVVDEAARAAGAPTQRLAGASRAETGVQIARFNIQELAARGQAPPGTAVAVNVRRDDGYTHVLAAAPIVGATAGVFVPVEGSAGDVLPRLIEIEVCGLQSRPLAVGGPDVVSDEVLGRVATAVGQAAC